MSEWMYRLKQEGLAMTDITRAQQDDQYTSLIDRYAAYQRKSVEGILGLTKVIYDAALSDNAVFSRFLAKIGHKRDSSYIKKCMIIGRSYERLIDRALNLPPHFESLYVIASMNEMHVSVSINRRDINHRSTLNEIKALKPAANHRRRRSFVEYEGKKVDKQNFINNHEGPEMRIYFSKEKAIFSTEMQDFFLFIQKRSRELGLGIEITRIDIPDLPTVTLEDLPALPIPAKAA